jgi:imidazolonepropionase-like amidohydrolase
MVYGDVLLDKGLIVAVGYIPPNLLASAKARGGGEMKVLDVAGKWITPGLVDLHSHIGVYSSPALKGMSRRRWAKSY